MHLVTGRGTRSTAPSGAEELGGGARQRYEVKALPKSQLDKEHSLFNLLQQPKIQALCTNSPPWMPPRASAPANPMSPRPWTSPDEATRGLDEG